MIRLKVQEVAAEKGISQTRLSRIADVDIKVVRRMYRNPTESFTTAVLDRIALALQVDIRELLESVTEPPAGQE